MLKLGNLLKTAQNRRGATAVIVAICLAMLLGFAALAVDVGYISTTKNELQNIADAAALAGAGHLGSEYEKLTYAEQQVKTFTFNEVAAVVQAVAEKNKAAGVNITIDYDINSGDIVIGNWNGSSVDPTLSQPDAVQVTAHRDSTMDNPVSTFFARIFKIIGADFDTVSVAANATAALTGSSDVGPGELKVPFGVSEHIWQNCTDLITFSPTTSSCAGWHNFGSNANAAKMDQNALGIIMNDGPGVTRDDGLVLKSGAEWLANNFTLTNGPEPVMTGDPDGFNTSSIIDSTGGTVASLFLGAVLAESANGGNDPSSYATYTDANANPNKPAPFFALFDYFRYRDNDTDWTGPDGTFYDKDEIWTTKVPVYKDDEDSCSNPGQDMKIEAFVDIKVIMPNPPPDNTVTVYIDCNQSVTQGRGGGGSGPLKGSIPQLVE